MALSDLTLMAWLSPAFPVGAFAYSHGLEWAFEAGDVQDAASLSAWLTDLMDFGSLHSDRVLIACAHQALASRDEARLREIADLALALCPSAERYLEATQQGGAFCSAIKTSWPHPRFDAAVEAAGEPVAYAVAFAMAVHAHNVPLDAALSAFGLGFLANLVSASVRLGIVGQSDGQRITALFAPLVEAQGGLYAQADESQLGTSCFRSDLASLHHETQYSRLFPLMRTANGPFRVGIGGPVGLGKTALMKMLCKRFPRDL